MQGLVVLVLIVGGVHHTEYKLVTPVKSGESVLAGLIQGIPWSVVRSKGLRSLTVIVCSRERVVALDLQAVRQTTIELQDQRIVFREHIAANLCNAAVARVWPGADEQRYAPSLTIEGPSHRRVSSEVRRRIQVGIHKVWQILAIGEKIRGRDDRVARDLPLENSVELVNPRQLEASGEVLHVRVCQSSRRNQIRVARCDGVAGKYRHLSLGYIGAEAG